MLAALLDIVVNMTENWNNESDTTQAQAPPDDVSGQFEPEQSCRVDYRPQGYDSAPEDGLRQQDFDSTFASPNSPDAPEPPARWNPLALNAPEGETQFQQPLGEDEPELRDPELKNWDPTIDTSQFSGTGVIGNTRFKLKGQELFDYQNARRAAIIATGVAIASLFFVGVFLSVFAIIIAIIACTRFERIAASRVDEPEVQRVIRRSSYIALIISVVALILNIIAAVYLQPLVMEALQTGDFGSLVSSSPTTTGTGGDGTTWG